MKLLRPCHTNNAHCAKRVANSKNRIFSWLRYPYAAWNSLLIKSKNYYWSPWYYFIKWKIRHKIKKVLNMLIVIHIDLDFTIISILECCLSKAGCWCVCLLHNDTGGIQSAVLDSHDFRELYILVYSLFPFLYKMIFGAAKEIIDVSAS